MQRAALAVAKDPRQRENLGLARRKKLFHRKFWRRMQVKRLAFAARAAHFGGKSMQVGLIAGRDLQRRRLDFDKALRGEVGAYASESARTKKQAGTAGGMALAAPKRGKSLDVPLRGN